MAQLRLSTAAETGLAHEQLTYDDLLRIVELIKSTEHFSEFRLKVGEIELELRRRKAPGGYERSLLPAATLPVASVAVTNDDAPAPPATPLWPAGSVLIRSPMIGTFYLAPQPGAAPFVKVGQGVEADTTVGIIEVMKLMNSIRAEVRGVVVQILVDDAAAVELDQPLIALRPDSEPR